MLRDCLANVERAGGCAVEVGDEEVGEASAAARKEGLRVSGEAVGLAQLEFGSLPVEARSQVDEVGIARADRVLDRAAVSEPVETLRVPLEHHRNPARQQLPGAIEDVPLV